MSWSYTHYVIIGDLLTDREVYDRFAPYGHMLDNNELIPYNDWNDDEFILVEEIIWQHKYSMGHVDLPKLLKKYSAERIFIFTRMI